MGALQLITEKKQFLSGDSRRFCEFPFSAIIGQPLLKKALMLLAVDPKIQGVLLSGPRGIAKSTTVRAFFTVLPDCSARHFVNLPIGTTEDRLVGSLHLEKVLTEKKVSFQDGLLAKAHHGILYADEVNLLSDHLVDNLLDVAASGMNYVERDGISHAHPSEFMLVGTMNPDEGELRPQLLDRFGLMVEMQSHFELDERIAIVERRQAFDDNPESFLKRYQDQQLAVTQDILAAKQQLPDVNFSIDMKKQIAKLCSESNCEGLRADLVFHRAVVANAALAGRKQVVQADIDAVKMLVLSHRQKPNLPDKPNDPPIEPPRFKRPPSSQPQSDQPESSQQSEGDYGALSPVQNAAIANEALLLPGSVAGQKNLNSKKTVEASKAKQKQVNDQNQPVDWCKSLIHGRGELSVDKLKWKLRNKRPKQGHCVILDTSGSTLKHSQIQLAKKLVLDLNHSIYLARQQVALVLFGNGETQLLRPLNKASKSFAQEVEAIQAGGGTPFMQMFSQLSEWVTGWVNKQDHQMTCHLITDGRMQVDLTALSNKDIPCEWKLYDMDLAEVRRGKSKQIAHCLGAEYFHIEELMV